MEKQVLSSVQQIRSNRVLLEEISNYIPDSYSMILKRNGDQIQPMNENNAVGYQLSSYYDKVALSSEKNEKKKQKPLEEGEIEPGSTRKKNKLEKRKPGKEGLVEVSKQLIITNKICNPMENNHNNSNTINTTNTNIINTQCGPVNYGEYLKEKQSKKDQKYEEKLEKKQLNLFQDLQKKEQETKKEYVNEPFPQILQSHEQLMLLKVWRQRNFMDFNTWVQKSGASIKITYQNDLQETISQRLSKKKAIIDAGIGCIEKFQKKQLFHCYIELRVDVLEKTIEITASAFSENKKDSKKGAFEILFKEISNRNLLWLGIKYKSYLDYIMAFDEVPNSAGGFHSAIRQTEPALFDPGKDMISLQEFQQARMHKLSKKMQFYISKDMFDEACKELVKMTEINIGLEWRWVSFLWSYCLRRKRVSELKYLLDIMQYGNVKREESEEQYCEIVKSRFHCIPALNDDTPQDEAIRQTVRRSLRMQYRDVVRLESTNIFDYYDPFNLELITDEQLPTHNGGIDVPEPIPRIFHENISTNLSKTSTTILKTTKPLYNYFANLQFPGQWSSQHSQLQLNPKNNPQQILIQNNNFNIQKKNNSNNSTNNSFHTQQHNQLKQPSDAFTSYLSLDMINSMYDTLIYTAADTQFALQAAEVIYKYAKVNPQQFISPLSAQYFLNRKVQLIQETIEAVSNSLYTSKSPQAISYPNAAAFFTNIKGSISQVGTVFEKDVYLFYPIENAAVLEKKLLKRNQIDGSQYHHQICEDDVVVLSCFFKPTYDKPFLKSIGIKLVDHFNEKCRKKEEAKPIDKTNIINFNKSFEEIPITEGNCNSTYNKAYVDSITEYGNKIEYAVIAQVKEIQKDLGVKLYILNPEKQLLEDTITSKTWKITKLCHIGSFEKHTESLQRATTKEEAMIGILNKILTAGPMTNPSYLRNLAETVVEQEKSIKNHDLNRQQQEAVLGGQKQCLTLIQAPNGSGKMRVVKRLIQMWQNHNNKQKVLLCVHSQGRMRQVFCSLKASNFNAIEVSEKQTTKIEFTGLKTSIPEYEKTNNSMPRYYHSLKKALLGSHVVITNCSSANYSVLKGLFFNKVIILDAENINESVCLEALTKQCQQLILIGDPQQQTIQSNSSFSSSRGYNISLFERLVRQGIRPFLLLQNYKIQVNAVQFLSKFFYKSLMFTYARSNKPVKRQIPSLASDNSSPHYQYPLHLLDTEFDTDLVNETNVSLNLNRTGMNTIINNSNNNISNNYICFTDIDNYAWPNSQIRINFINVEGYELLTSESIINVKDAEVSIHVILYLFKSKTIHKDQFCIVTPYASQKQLIITELDYHIKNNPNLFNMDEQEVLNIKSATDIINVKTIEEIDSRYDFILFSTVRSNKEGKMGSLRDPRKLNSIISKANEALVIIGDAYTLDSEYIWREFIIWCKENSLIYQYSN